MRASFSSTFLATCVVALTFGFLSATNVPVQAQQDPKSIIVAIVGDKTLSLEDVQRAFETLPPQVQQQGLGQVFPRLTEVMAQQMAITYLAEQAGVEDTPQAQAMLTEARARVLHDVYLSQTAETRISEEELRADYDGYVAQNPPSVQVRASHILVPSEDKAREIIAMVEAGRDFAELAKEFSIGPSASGGGDLGFFGRGQMVPPFDAAAFGLEANQFTADPVQTQFGWHVIYVTDKRSSLVPTYEELRPNLLRQRVNLVADQIATELAATVAIERFDVNGAPLAAPQ